MSGRPSAWVSALLLSLALCGAAGKALAGEPLRSVQAEFSQEKHLPILARPLLSSGTFAFQAPHSLRWEYHSPLHTITLMDGSRVSKLVERDGRFSEDGGAGLGSMPIIMKEIGSWLNGRFSDNPMFAVEQTTPGLVVLKPKDAGLEAMISRIELKLGAEPGLVDMVTIYEGAEAWTKMTFTKAILNQDIPAEVFAKP